METRVRFPVVPYAHQNAAFALCVAVRFVVLVWHRRAGKTVFAFLRLMLAAVLFDRLDGRFAYIAPLYKQAKSVGWDLLKRFARLVPGAKLNESELRVDFPNGARITLCGADNPDALRGIYLDGVVLDEVADMRPEVWGEIIRPALADRQGWALFIGTPKGVNLFSELYYRAAKGEADWAADLKRAGDTGVIPVEELEQARREMSDPQYAQEFECDFAAAVDDVLVRLDEVLGAQARDFHVSQYDFAARVLGVDVARYGGDRTVLFPRQGLVAFTPRILRNTDTMTIAAHVAQTNLDWKPDAIFVDVGGYGAGVVDRLLQLHVQGVVPVDFGGKPLDTRFENKRAEMWWLMAQWVKQGRLPPGTDIAQDLTAPRYTFANARGRLQLESKDDMRARGLPSPDVADALATTFAAPVAPRERLADGSVAPRRSGTVVEYDPYARGDA